MSGIISISASDYKQFDVIRIDIGGRSMTLRGKNKLGKTTILDMIMSTLCGDKYRPKDPIRHGKKKARVVIETDDYTITRTFTPNGGGSVKIRSKGARKPGLPQTTQALLTELFGCLTWDPSEWVNKKPKERAKDLQALVPGCDFTALDARRKGIYDGRADTNRDKKKAAAQLEKAERHDDAPAAEVSAAELVAEVEKANAVNVAHEAKRAELGRVGDESDAIIEQIAELDAKLAAVAVRGKALKAEVKVLTDVDTAPLRERIEQADETNRRVRANAEHARLTAEHERLDAESDAASAKIIDLDAERAKRIAGAEYPIKGLAFDVAGEITLGGVPFDDASDAEQLQCAVAIGCAQMGEIGIILVRQASFFDSACQAEVVRIAEAAGAQVIMEVVSDEKTMQVIFHESANDEPTADEQAIEDEEDAARRAGG